MVKIFSAILACFALLSPVYGDNTQDLLSGLIDKYTGLPAIQNKSKDIIEAQTKNINPIVKITYKFFKTKQTKASAYQPVHNYRPIVALKA